MDTDQYAFTVKEACQILKISRQKMYLLIRSGKVKAFTIGDPTKTNGHRHWRLTKKMLDDFIYSQIVA